MQLEDTSVCADPQTVIHERVVAFLLSRGYRQDGAALIRGSWWGTLASLNPRKWAVRTTLESLAADTHRLRFDVNTTGHPLITAAERKFWEDELQATSNVLVGTAAPDLDAAEAEAKSAGWQMAKLILLYSCAFSVAFGVAQYLLFQKGIRVFPGFPGVGSGIGVGIGMHAWRSAEAKKKALQKS